MVSFLEKDGAQNQNQGSSAKGSRPSAGTGAQAPWAHTGFPGSVFKARKWEEGLHSEGTCPFVGSSGLWGAPLGESGSSQGGEQTQFGRKSHIHPSTQACRRLRGNWNRLWSRPWQKSLGGDVGGLLGPLPCPLLPRSPGLSDWGPCVSSSLTLTHKLFRNRSLPAPALQVSVMCQTGGPEQSGAPAVLGLCTGQGAGLPPASGTAEWARPAQPAWAKGALPGASLWRPRVVVVVFQVNLYSERIPESRAAVRNHPCILFPAPLAVTSHQTTGTSHWDAPGIRARCTSLLPHLLLFAPASLLPTWQLGSAPRFCDFIISGTLHKGNHTACNLRGLAFSTARSSGDSCSLFLFMPAGCGRPTAG